MCAVHPWIETAVAALGAVGILLVDRNPAPADPLPQTETDADHITHTHPSH